MAETDAEPRANPIFLGILFAGILATLVFILMTGDYGEPTLPEELVMVQPSVEPAPAPAAAQAPAAPIVYQFWWPFVSSGTDGRHGKSDGWRGLQCWSGTCIDRRG